MMAGCLLCPTGMSAQKEKQVFRPVSTTFPRLAEIDKFVGTWVSTYPLNNGVEMTCEQKAPNGEQYGVGSVWAVWVTSQMAQQGVMTKFKELFEVKSIIPGSEIVLQATRDNSTLPQNCCVARPPNYPQIITIRTTDKGENTDVSVKMEGRAPAFYHFIPKFFFFIPVFWPHMLIWCVTLTLCYPCCQHSMKGLYTTQLTNQCDQGLTALKCLCEKGPEDQRMMDTTGAPIAGGDFGFCPKCGNKFPNKDDPFCGKCGAAKTQ